MTCAEIIARVDELEPNQYGTEQKMQWLSNLDDELLDECILTHKLDKTGRELELMLGTCPLPPYRHPDATLLLADRYGVELYSSYLQMMIAKENSRFSMVEVALSSRRIRLSSISCSTSQSRMAWASVMFSPGPLPPETMTIESG